MSEAAGKGCDKDVAQDQMEGEQGFSAEAERRDSEDEDDEDGEGERHDDVTQVSDPGRLTEDGDAEKDH